MAEKPTAIHVVALHEVASIPNWPVGTDDARLQVDPPSADVAIGLPELVVVAATQSVDVAHEMASTPTRPAGTVDTAQIAPPSTERRIIPAPVASWPPARHRDLPMHVTADTSMAASGRARKVHVPPASTVVAMAPPAGPLFPTATHLVGVGQAIPWYDCTGAGNVASWVHTPTVGAVDRAATLVAPLAGPIDKKPSTKRGQVSVTMVLDTGHASAPRRDRPFHIRGRPIPCPIRHALGSDYRRRHLPVSGPPSGANRQTKATAGRVEPSNRVATDTDQGRPSCSSQTSGHK